jgi:hypothetical protein
MPIHLPPLSRRNFLKRSLVAGAGLLLAPSLFAARKRTDPHTWAMLADTHIAANPAELGRGVNKERGQPIVWCGSHCIPFP